MDAYVRLLGPPAVRTSDGWHALATGKAAGVLCYLAYHADWLLRSDLLYLFWPDRSEREARGNLRPLLTKVRRLPYVDRLETDADRIRWSVTTDLQAFREAVASGERAQALAAYGGPLMRGLDVAGAPEFDSWLTIARAELTESWRGLALDASDDLAGSGRLERAAKVLKAVLDEDPYDEDALRRAMRVACLRGDRRGALHAYATFEQRLHDELSIEPDVETHDLARAVRAGRCGEPPVSSASPGPPSSALDRSGGHLPRPSTPFVGRRAELERVASLLRDPACRLVTLVGPGGIGKTRLALRIADDADRGVPVFVACDRAALPEDLPTTIATALGAPLFGTADARTQLIEHLRDRRLLLVLDNLEHLVPDDGLLDALLAACPMLTVVATSRRRLDIRAEWVVDVRGLTYPEPDEARRHPLRSAATSDAVALFVQAANRAKVDVALHGPALDAVVDICCFVEGMPLALEIAASWVRLLRPDEIAQRLRSCPELLDGAFHDGPPRHRSMRAVFDHTWALLTASERGALVRLAAFRGGFTLEAARDAMGVGLPTLLALVNKSLLRREPTGRFDFHALVQRDIAARARGDAAAWRDAAERHAAYFVAFAERHDAPPGDAGAALRTQALGDELENTEAAWAFAAAEGREDWLTRAAPSLGWCYYASAAHQRGFRVMHDALEKTVEPTVLRGRLLTFAALLLDRHDLERSIAMLQEATELLERHDADDDLAFALRVLGTRLHRLGRAHAETAAATFRSALERYRASGDGEGVAMMLNNLAYHAPSLDEAERMLLESIASARRAGALHALSHALDTHAELLAYGRGDLRRASDAMLESLARMEETGDTYSLPLMRLRFARILLRSGQAEAADRIASQVEAAAGPESDATRMFRCDAAVVRAAVALERGDARAAVGACERAQAGAAGVLPDHTRLHLLVTAVRASLAAGALDAARCWLDLATDALEHVTTASFEHREAAIVVAAAAAELHLVEGRMAASLAAIAAARRAARDAGLLPARIECALADATIAARSGRVARSERVLRVVRAHPAATTGARARAASMLGEPSEVKR